MTGPSSRPGGEVLVSGAGVAGPALAFWLLHAGLTPVIVESAPGPRAGGYMIDFWGPGFEAAERMGLASRLRDVGYMIRELRLVDAKGKPDAVLPIEAFSRYLGDRYLSLLRGDLASVLLESVAGRVEIVFGDEVTGLEERLDCLEATFRGAGRRRFDLVFGADGLHSRIRRLAFGGESGVTPLGYFVAAFTADGYARRDEDVYVSRTVPGRQVARCGLKDGRTTIFMFVASRLAGGRPLDTVESQRAFLLEAFADIGWEWGEIAEALKAAGDLYFDEVAQVRLPAWSKGRVALVGDAAWCPSLLAGEGASLAMAGALVLAGELAAADGDHRVAFERYERRLRREMDRKQRSALRMAAWFAPRTGFGVLVRNQLTRLSGLPGLGGLIAGPMVRDDLTLPEYAWGL